MTSPIREWETAKRWFFSSIVFAIAILAVFYILRAYQQSIPLLTWIQKYSQPEMGYALISILLVSLVWFIISLGIVREINFWGWTVEFDPDKPHVFRFIFGLPLILDAALTVVCIVCLMALPPSCEVPSVVFSVRAGNSQPQEYTPDSQVELERAGSVIVLAKSYPEQDELICDFQIKGDVVDRPGVPNKLSCTTTIFLKKDIPGNLMVSANIKGKYCSLESTYNLPIHFK
jgi:hypothetical protein